ncbi:hypothetical protein BMS_1558 [Halobacteriovorax marinus SJ]|uniref:Uncharacterized protein n=1 Tax=Halobacteriovorax marinus (strain ATCC BAA-682 / DSM 15412 / SJ) TaxID=862908 RepID=E1X0S3_HALMS|nr:hypothetical protein [Halobacteriovorax marinus]CBW26411.1 hypothetical protein BMS_1558 [Halobacteriovorax marinus SJ]
MSKSKNPLYHVSNDGKDVESVSGVVELMIKKLGLDPMVEFLVSLLEMMQEQVKSYAMFVAIKELIDELLEKIFKVMEKVTPLLNF